MEPVRCVEGFIAGLFLGGNGWVEFAGGDLFGARVNEAKLAGGKVSFLGAHRRAERSAEDGAVLVEIASPVFEVEHRARLIVGELFEEDSGFVIFVENPGSEVAGKPRIEPGERVGYAGADAGSAFRVSLFEGGKAFAETRAIFVRDGKDADTALRAAWFADEVCAAATVSVSYGCVYDLDETMISHRFVLPLILMLF